MDRLGQRDNVLLGYALRDPFGNLHHPLPPPHHRNSDVDFADVFGGPPRRSSFYDRRRSQADSLDSRARPRTLYNAEKPAFGELDSPSRRRPCDDDFYDDIFLGSDSDSSTPKIDRDPFPSTPGSRVLSPNRPVFVGGSSLPSQLSLPKAKFAIGAENEDGDFDVSSFPYSQNSSRASAAPDDLRSFGHAFHRQSPSASQLFRGTFRSSETLSKGNQSERYAASIEHYINSSQFHFSIHKWAGKGVSLSLSSLSEEQDGFSRYSTLPELVIHTDDLPSDDDEMSISTGGANDQTENHGNKVVNEIFESKNDAGSTNAENVLPEIDPNYSSRSFTGNSGTNVRNGEDVSAAMPANRRPELRNLHQLFHDAIEQDGPEASNKHIKGGQKHAIDGVEVKKQTRKQNHVEHVDSISPSMKDFPDPVTLEEKMQGNRGKGRVKDFIKIFNVEGSPKRKGIFDSGDRKSKDKDRVKGKVAVQVSASTAKANEEVKAAPPHHETFGIDPVEVDEILKRGGVPSLYMSFDVPVTNDSSSERNEFLGSSSASEHESIKESTFSVEESHFEDHNGCLVEQLSEQQTESQQPGLHDQIQIANAKIREWSKGKEGNIRSLLSTLQYVLWPESGWKPVPLVDIIEGSSVKRAYQRALLYLHPDKLQQRGAAEHQKYIAEKVFGILQEAWDQFNSVIISYDG